MSEHTDEQLPDGLPDIFAPFERLVDIELLGTKVAVPENNTLMRCFQYLSYDSIADGDFCWNGDCLNCQVWTPNGEKEKALIACRAIVQEGMSISRVSEGFDLSEITGPDTDRL